jgi:hypothetical protein
MSRSNPHASAPNPSTRWFEWNGEKGNVRYYDKEAKKNIDVALPFKFVLLDQLSSVRGWHELSKSGIYSNEVRDTRQDAMIVKAFKAGILAEGVYQTIKDRVKAVGGKFNANCYLAFKNGGGAFSLGCIRFQGAALGAWMDFTKAHRADIYKKAVAIYGSTTGQKGRITYHMPAMKLSDIPPEVDTAAIALDKELQEWLSAYLSRNLSDRTETAAAHVADEDMPDSYEPPDEYDGPPASPVTDDDILW